MRSLPRSAALAAALLLAACATTRPASRPVEAAPAVPFVEDDYAGALAQARARGVPLFVDAWAPWCHTCRFMRAHVFTDPALSPRAAEFVWLSIDTEKEGGAAFLERFPLDVWPTLMVIDPASETAVLRWPGSATASQLGRLLDDGKRALAEAAAPPSGDDALSLLARADRLAAGRSKEALAAYREALARVPPERRPRVVESLVMAQLAGHDYAGCARTAIAETPSLPRGPSFANAVATGLVCAGMMPADQPERRPAISSLEPLAREAVALPGLLADDRSVIHEALVDAREASGDADGARAQALLWLAFLEGEAARAATVEARAAFDPHRVAAALKAGVPERAVAALEQSERDLPADYNAPARLALLHRAMGKLDAAQADIERALARVYGPRTLRVLEIKAQIEAARGDPAAARRTLERALSTAEGLPPAQGRDMHAARVRGLLARAQ